LFVCTVLKLVPQMRPCRTCIQVQVWSGKGQRMQPCRHQAGLEACPRRMCAIDRLPTAGYSDPLILLGETRARDRLREQRRAVPVYSPKRCVGLGNVFKRGCARSASRRCVNAAAVGPGNTFARVTNVHALRVVPPVSVACCDFYPRSSP